MKPVEEVTACVVDYGTFISVAEKFGETMKRVYYYSPFEREYQDLRDCIHGWNLDHCERLDEFLDPDVFDSIDLFIFPDIGFGGLQKHLRRLGKAVWGSMGADELELYRTYFLEVLEQVKLPIIHSVELTGLTKLAAHLKDNPDKWIKIDRFRRNMETWHHIDYQHSQRMLDSLAVIFGGAKETLTFIVQDPIDSELEIGYDGWCVDGQFPSQSFQGYEKKNELYLGSLLSREDLPDELTIVNERIAPILKQYGYRNWWASEIRVAKGVPYFIDPTARMAGQTVEHQLESCTNLADIVWRGANGELIEPEFAWQFAAEATLHYDAGSDDVAIVDEWKTLDIPEHMRQWLKLYHYCKIDDLYNFLPQKNDEVGVLLGFGDSLDESIIDITDNLTQLKDLPIHANVAGFVDLVESIKAAEKEGLSFGSKIPSPESIFKKIEKAL